MPITPFHGGIGLAAKAPLARRFSFVLFAATQVAIDLESAYHLATGQYPIHTFFHTFIGATLVCLATVLLLRRPCERFLERIGVRGDIPLSAAIVTAFFGVIGHVVPDAIMHSDVRPFAPFTDANPFLDAISLASLHLGLMALGAIGLMVIAVRATIRRPPEEGGTDELR